MFLNSVFTLRELCLLIVFVLINLLCVNIILFFKYILIMTMTDEYF